MPEASPADSTARALIADALDDTLVVEAAAGTGKTTELVTRMLRVLATGRATVGDIVAVTFTEKAAGELKLRLREQLEVERGRSRDAGETARLDEAVRHLEEARVSTIHGFCADLLRERPVESGVDPLFRVLTEGQSERLFDEAFRQWFQACLEDPPEGVRRSLQRASKGARPGVADEDGPVERLRRAGLDLIQWRDFRAPWTREPFDRDAAAGSLVEQVHAFADLSAQPSYVRDNLFIDTDPVRRLSRDIRQARLTVAADGESIEAWLIGLRRSREFGRSRKGSGATYGPGVARAQVLDARTALAAALDEFQMHADSDLAAALHGELQPCVDAYEVLKTREGALDFLDLLLRARDLLVQDREVRGHFQQRFRRIFVDEFQDTDPLQAEILLLLAADDQDEARARHVRPVPGKLFLVGDPKQSIYRFRRADVDLYRAVRAQLLAAGARSVTLETSFRSVPGIQRFVNAAFRPLMDTGDGYVPLAPVRGDHGEQPSVVALPVPRPYARRQVAASAIVASLPDAVGAWVHWLLHESGWTVTDRRYPGKRLPVAARHVCVLFRRFVSWGTDVTRPYVEALEARGVPHLLVGGRAFHGREEIETLRAALAAIEWPDDQLSVFATLRGALFAIGDEALLEYRHGVGTFHPFRVPESLPEHLSPIGEALSALRELHARRNLRPVAETVTRLLALTRAHVGFVLRPGGEQALANVQHVAELGRQYEIDGGMSFRGFVHALQQAAEGGQAGEAPILEEGSDGVRVMTVHKAKGLEFPVVILADITARLAPAEAGRHVNVDERLCAMRIGGWSPAELRRQQPRELEQELREGERIAYVAATRARDVLVVPAVGDGPWEGGWVSPLSSALYPLAVARRDSRQAPGCPPFASRDSVLERPDGDPASSATVCPGLHALVTSEGGHDVAWWSPEPGVLDLGAQAPFGLRRDDLIVRDVETAVLTAQHRAYRAWRETKDEAVARARVPTIDAITVTELAAEGAGVVDFADIAVDIERVEVSEGRVGGARFGSLVHALLADAPLEASGDLAPLAVAHGRLLGATADEVEAAAEAAALALAHPLLRRAAAAALLGRCHREMPVTVTLASGRLVEGTVDLAFEEDGSYVIVDFKTDRELGALERYTRQVQVYVAAVAAATGRPARGILMQV